MIAEFRAGKTHDARSDQLQTADFELRRIEDGRWRVSIKIRQGLLDDINDGRLSRAGLLFQPDNRE